jgi:cell division protein FtsQ
MPSSDRVKHKRKPAPGLIPGVTYRRGSMGEARSPRNVEGIPILNWLTPEHMLAAANWLLLLALLLALFVGFRLLAQHTRLFELKGAVVSGPLQRANAAQLGAVLRGLSGDFLSVDLKQAQQQLEAVPWVRRAELKREFPNRLRVRIEEHVPLARWGESALVNTFGELFEADYAGALPAFEGPDGTELTVTESYARFWDILKPIGLRPTGVTLTARGAWKVALANALTLELGRDKVDQRIKTFASVYQATLAQVPDLKGTVDLRYSNGFALKASKDLLPKREPGQDGRG